jgi:hypothetical protein
VGRSGCFNSHEKNRLSSGKFHHPGSHGGVLSDRGGADRFNSLFS